MHVRERKTWFFLPWAHSYPGKPEESDSPGTVDTGTCEPSDMGAGKQAQVILQSLAQCFQHCGLENLACGLGEVLEYQQHAVLELQTWTWCMRFWRRETCEQ